MAALLLVVLFLALIILSTRFGYNSRESIYSEEEQLASYGVTW